MLRTRIWVETYRKLDYFSEFHVASLEVYMHRNPKYMKKPSKLHFKVSVKPVFSRLVISAN